MKIGVMGAGGVGGYIGGRLATEGHDVAFIARGQHLEAILETGLRVQSPDGDFTIESPPATDDPGQIGPVDLILFSVKTYDGPAAIEMIKPTVGPHTVVLPVLNGVTHIEQLGDRLGYDHVLGGMANLGAHIAEPGLIRHFGTPGPFEFGEIGGGVSERCKKLQSTLTQKGIIEFKATPSVLDRMWWKFAGACAIGGGLAVVRGSYGTFRDFPETLELLFGAQDKVVAVAQAKGVFFSILTIDEAREFFKRAPPDFKPSMVVDLESGKRLELEALNGAASRHGKELGVPTPINDFIYACLKPYANGRPER